MTEAFNPQSVLRQRGRLAADAPFLTKPFSAEALCRAVREVLDT